jgi:hypothetical protein
MAGTIVSDTVQDGAGNSTSTTTVINGSAKAWINFSASAGGGTINGSFNVSSITRNGTGDYTLNYTTAMTNANYAIVGGAGANTASGYFCQINYNAANTTTTSRIGLLTFAGGPTDAPIASISVFR